MGFGVNLVTGDYSQGAAGLWIENGELAYPVEEITIAGNLKDMYRNISAIGNDLTFRSASAAPTLRIEGMMIAGSYDATKALKSERNGSKRAPSTKRAITSWPFRVATTAHLSGLRRETSRQSKQRYAFLSFGLISSAPVTCSKTSSADVSVRLYLKHRPNALPLSQKRLESWKATKTMRR
jgi:hypothetical protein